jgi:hypothetical protein
MSEKLALHAVIIKKPCNLDEAREVSQHYINNPKKNFMRETKTSYRFRNFPKGHFIPKSYKTKKINNKVSIIIGHLKPEHEHLEGSGIGDFFKKIGKTVKNIFTPRLDSYNNQTRKSLEQFGNMPVKRLTIYRTPIMKILDKVINLISFGKFGELKKKYGFDTLYHLALIADLGNKTLVIEKNEVINVSTSYNTSNKTEKLDVPLNGKDFTINEMFEVGRKNVGEKKWFLYDPFSNNCQYFIKYCLESINLYGTQEKDFLFQDLTELAKELPSYTKKIAKTTTDIGAVVNKLTGRGETPITMKKGSKAEKDFIDYILKHNFKDEKEDIDFDIEKIFQDWSKTQKGMNFLKKHLVKNNKKCENCEGESSENDSDEEDEKVEKVDEEVIMEPKKRVKLTDDERKERLKKQKREWYHKNKAKK